MKVAIGILLMIIATLVWQLTVKVRDHFVVAGTSFLSYAERGLL